MMNTEIKMIKQVVQKFNLTRAHTAHAFGKKFLNEHKQRTRSQVVVPTN